MLKNCHDFHNPDQMSIRAARFGTLILAIIIASTLAYGASGRQVPSDIGAANRSGIATNATLAKTSPIENVTSCSFGGVLLGGLTITPFPGPCGPAYPNGFRQLTELVIRDQATWTRVWNQGVCAGLTPCNSNPPTTDFSSETVIAVFQGWQGSTGYGIRILGADHKGHEMIVHVEVVEPGPCRVGLAWLAILTYPFDIVSIPNTRFTVVFDTTTIATSCQ